MPKKSAGLLLYRKRKDILEVFLAHPGGPFFVNKDSGFWGIPKGLIDEGEDALAAAQREFEEETGFKAEGPFLPLTAVTQKGGKVVQAWAFEGDVDAEKMRSNTFTLEWPPHSGKQQEFPEVDRGAWFSINEAKQAINVAQVSFLEELQRLVGAKG
jgi:predicted NUDIX family NTP pyrophosphohydrolase